MGLFVFAMVMIMIVSVLLILVVLVQNSKGGGLASNFASSNQYMGVRKTADFLEKATWTLAIGLVIFCLISVVAIPDRVTSSADTELREQIENTAPLPSSMIPPDQE